MKKILLSFSLVILSLVASAQQYPCPFVDAGPDQNLPCGTNCTNVTASWLPAFATTSYTLAPISYTPYNYLSGIAPPNPFYTQDDYYSGIINLPFTFCFFGNAYNQCVIGNNGMISFNTAYASQSNPWNLQTGSPGNNPLPSAQNQLNCIMGPYMDVAPFLLSVQDSNYVNYATFGSAPCRKFVVSYYQTPYYNSGTCPNTLLTSQIVLYETTNVIEVYIGNKAICTGWNNGLAIEGIQNATGTVAYPVPGRNVSQWAATNDGYRWTPAGNSIVTVNWFQGATPIGSGPTVSVCPPNNRTTTYTAVATYNGCGNPVSVTDDVTIHVLQSAGATQYISCPSPSTSITTNATGTGTWTQIQGPASTTITPASSPTATITGFSQAGTYLFQWSSGVCSDTLTVNVTQRPDAGPDQNICRYDTAQMNAYGTGSWSALSTNPHATHIDSPLVNHSLITGFDTGGAYKFVWTTGPGCSDTVTINIPFFDLATSTSNSTVCQYSNTTVTVTPSTSNLGPFTYQWLQPALVQSPTSATTLINALAASTWFKVQVTSADGCKLIDSVLVNTSPNVGTNVRATAFPTVICPGDPVTLVALANPNSCGPAVTACTAPGTTVNLGTGTTTQGGTGFVYPAPYGSYYKSAHHQFLIHASEIMGQVPTGGQIKSLSLQIGTLNSGAPLTDFTIKLACVGNDSLDNAFLARGSSTTVYTAATYTPVNGWNTHTFQTAYDWDGVSNLIVDICFNNANGGNTNPKMKYTTTPFKSVWCTYGNDPQGQCAIIGVQQNTSTTYASLFQRPNMRLNMCITDLNNANLQWTPSSGPNAPTPTTGDTVVPHPVSTTTYQVALTSANGCINYAYATVNVDTSAKLTLSPDTFVCSVQPIRLNALLTGDSARPATATYTWTASAGTAPPSGTGPTFATYTVTPSQTTTYTVVVTGGSRCTLVDSITVTVGNGLPVPKLVDSISCAGQTDGRIHLYMNAGIAPYQYVWSPLVAGNVDSAVGLGPGTYTVQVTDAQGCIGRDTTRLVAPAPLTLRLDSTNIPCYGGGTGSVTATASGGRPGYTYVWNPSGSGTTLTNQPAGTYSVQVFDNSGCSVTGTTHITQPTQVISTAATTSLSGAGTHDGTITVTASGGTPGYTYTSVPSVSGLPNATGLDTGIYIITVCDANSCCVRDTAHVSGPPPIDVVATITNNNCYGQCTGQISVTASGGVSPYTFTWNTTPQTTGPSVSNLCAGSYTVTVRDANGITVANTYPVTSPPALGDKIDSTLITCYGAADGALSDSAYGGTAPYTITWTPGGSNPLSNLGPGTYAVLITDANGCTFNDQASLGQPSQLVAVLDSTHPTTCYGTADGTAWISVSGGTPPYDITWSGSNATTTVANDLDAGTHTATVTDAHGCSTTVSATITQPAQISTTISTTAAHCETSNDGSATVQVSGGTAPYSYNWDNTFGSTTQGNLSAGSHTLIITDSYNCTFSSSVNIDTLYVLHLDITSTPTSCFDGNDGTATVTALNGAPIISYAWSDINSTITNPATGLSSDIYSVSVTDAYGCTAETSVLVDEPSQLVAVADWTDPLCHGDANGKMWFSASGGQGPYYYTYNGLNYQMTDTVTGLAALPNPYLVVVYDSKGCSENVAVTLHDPTQLTIDTTVTQITCANAQDGAITANGAGGTPGYTYSWAPVSSTSNAITGLAPGTYTVTLTDAHGCTISNSVTLVAPPPMSVTYLHADSVSCVGSTDGHAVITVTGGTPGTNPPYTYSLNGGTPQDNPNFYDLAAGVYQIEAIDSKGCHLDTALTVETPLSVNVAINPLDTTLELGSSITLDLLVDNPGGQTVTAYSWSPSAGLTCVDCPAPVATPYQRQDYTVVVTYGKNCTATASATVRVNHGPDNYIPNAFSPNGDGTNDEFTVYGSGLKTVTMRVFNRWGEKVFDSGDNQWASWDGTYKGVLQPPAVYTYVVELVYLDGKKKIKDGSLTLIR